MDKVMKYDIREDPFLRKNGIYLEEDRRDYTRFTAMITEEQANPYGVAHGGFLYMMSDIAAGIAADSDGRSYVTYNASYTFIKGAPIGTRVYAEAWPVSRRHRTCVVKAEIYDDQRELLTEGTYIMYKISDHH
ncbi:PaaI family thioesterase [Clostridium vitabionis]|jgi:acyl-CoA thioesterase|uniref:PaaI family thioesterase n=1 Tax=Clostridium vitabionis TaxID=2784388 RepID=UPI00188D386A|nr:PaaI family thioesterase [Clostridium vitabionis]